MSSRIPKQNKGDSRPPRNKMSVLTVAFAIAMAFFLVIGAVAVGITEFVGQNDEQVPEEDPIEQQMEEQSEGEEQELRDRIEEDPDDYSAHSQLAVLLGNSGRIDEAIDHYERALEGDPDDHALRMSFARALEQRGYDLDARVQLERVLENDDENAEAMFLLAEIKMRSQPPEQEEAEELYERVIEIDPDSYHAEMAEERLADPEEDPEEEGDQDNDGDPDQD